jgi:hypothetical protein
MGICFGVLIGLTTVLAFKFKLIQRGHCESGDFGGDVLSSASWTFFAFG